MPSLSDGAPNISIVAKTFSMYYVTSLGDRESRGTKNDGNQKSCEKSPGEKSREEGRSEEGCEKGRPEKGDEEGTCEEGCSEKGSQKSREEEREQEVGPEKTARRSSRLDPFGRRRKHERSIKNLKDGAVARLPSHADRGASGPAGVRQVDVSPEGRRYRTVLRRHPPLADRRRDGPDDPRPRLPDPPLSPPTPAPVAPRRNLHRRDQPHPTRASPLHRDRQVVRR